METILQMFYAHLQRTGEWNEYDKRYFGEVLTKDNEVINNGDMIEVSSDHVVGVRVYVAQTMTLTDVNKTIVYLKGRPGTYIEAKKFAKHNLSKRQ